MLATGSMAAINPVRYRGYYFDSEINWYYLESRYYNPEWRRFISPDCLFVAGDVVTGSNMYAYCNNNPTRDIDSTGSVPEMNVDLNSAAEGVRIVSGHLSKILTPITDNHFSGITDSALADLKNVFKIEEY